MATGENEHSLENLHIPNIVSRLDEDERSLRFALQDCILSAGRPVNIGDVIPFLDERIDADRAVEILQSLIGKEIVVEEADGDDGSNIGKLRSANRSISGKNWRKCMGIEPTWEGISPPHWI